MFLHLLFRKLPLFRTDMLWFSEFEPKVIAQDPLCPADHGRHVVVSLFILCGGSVKFFNWLLQVTQI